MDNADKNVMSYEELSINAHPAPKTELYDGWILSFADGYTMRANSVSPLYESSVPIGEKIEYCIDAYKYANLPPAFKITPNSADLDPRLEKMGFRVHTPTNVMARNITGFTHSCMNAAVSGKISAEWRQSYFRLKGLNEKEAQTAERIQNKISGKTFCSMITGGAGGNALACGLCVAERGYAGLYDIIVDPGFRGRGFGYEICASLLCAASGMGARVAYLQVLEDNAPAIGLYEKLGFSFVYKYWYRILKLIRD